MSIDHLVTKRFRQVSLYNVNRSFSYKEV
jgi:hypothetical protein